MDEVDKLFIIWPFWRYSYKENNKNNGSNFPHPLACGMALFVARTKKVICMLAFLSVIEDMVVLCHFFVVVFAHALVAFTHNPKELSSREKVS